jgi:phage baseplate assembly protein W
LAGERLRHQEFNSVLLEAIDESIGELLGQRVLESLYSALEKHNDVTRDELPYRLDTAYRQKVSRELCRTKHNALMMLSYVAITISEQS